MKPRTERMVQVTMTVPVRVIAALRTAARYDPDSTTGEKKEPGRYAKKIVYKQLIRDGALEPEYVEALLPKKPYEKKKSDGTSSAR